MTTKLSPLVGAISLMIALSLNCTPARAHHNNDKGKQNTDTAQNTDKSLVEQLKQQYKPSETVFIVQKDGILGVPSNKAVAPEAQYKEGELHTPGFGQLLVVGTDTRKFQLHEKVRLMQITASVKHDKVVFQLEECAACNGNEFDYRAFLAFIFPKGYLATADVGQIEDVISQVLTIDSGKGDAQQQDVAPPAAASPDPAPAAAPAPPPLPIQIGQTIEQVQADTNNGLVLAADLGDKKIYQYNGLKITFVKGKVTDVQ
jgi:hypothetical protein